MDRELCGGVKVGNVAYCPNLWHSCRCIGGRNYFMSKNHVTEQALGFALGPHCAGAIGKAFLGMVYGTLLVVCRCSWAIHLAESSLHTSAVAGTQNCCRCEAGAGPGGSGTGTG